MKVYTMSMPHGFAMFKFVSMQMRIAKRMGQIRVAP